MTDHLFVFLPAAIVMLALPIGQRWRGTDETVRAVYLFHRSGDPLATVASDLVPPMVADRPGPVLEAVRTLVGTPSAGREFRPTGQRFEDEALAAAQGRFMSACAVYHGSSDGPLGRNRVRFVREFEASNEAALGSWSDATSIADVASRAMFELVASQTASGVPGEGSSVRSSAKARARVAANGSSTPA